MCPYCAPCCGDVILYYLADLTEEGPAANTVTEPQTLQTQPFETCSCESLKLAGMPKSVFQVGTCLCFNVDASAVQVDVFEVPSFQRPA